jgi:hypothetical protein
VVLVVEFAVRSAIQAAVKTLKPMKYHEIGVNQSLLSSLNERQIDLLDETKSLQEA